MKKICLMLMVLAVATVSFAQNKLVAALSHDNHVTMFYGSAALTDALEAAEHGDVITLSGGTFAAAPITKGVAIRGVGVEAEDPTVIDIGACKNFYISIGEGSTMTMEGIRITVKGNSSNSFKLYGTSSNLYVIKCTFGCTISFESSSSVRATFVNCNTSTLSLDGASTVKLSNCRVAGYRNVSTTTSKADFFNCLLYSGSCNTWYRSSFVNCIMWNNNHNNTYSLSEDASAMNCLAIQTRLMNVVQQVDCVETEFGSIPNIFKTTEKTTDRYLIDHYTPTAPYELTDEAKTTYIGTDGKEIGLYGGQYPYSLTPTYPLITKMSVAKQATADNKLSVEIEVSATE